MINNIVCIFIILNSFSIKNGFTSEYIMAEAIKHVAQSLNTENHLSTSVENTPITQSINTKRDIIKSEQTNPSSKSSINNSYQNDLNPSSSPENLVLTNKNNNLTDQLFSIEWKNFLITIIKVFFIILCSFLIWNVSNRIAENYIKKVRLFKKMSSNSSTSTQSLINTMLPILKSIVHWILIILTILMVIREFVDITPIFLGIGFVGVALTIGSQTLMKDLVNGILLLFEGNVAVGDVVTIGDKIGTVESISLRALSLRHFTGELQTIALSEVNALINCSRDYSIAVVEFVVDPKALISSIELALYETFQIMKNDSKFGTYIIGELSNLGVKKMSEIGVTMTATIPIKPDPKKEFLSEFNKQFYERLQQNDVQLAYARL